jgi:hypothetical protein
MSESSPHFSIGDLVEVKSPVEILQTLDGNGTLNELPFMPEMVLYCGKRYRVARRVFKTCVSGTREFTDMRGFKSDDVVMLEEVRCTGVDHDGCQKFCMILWRDAWLRGVDNPELPARNQNDGIEELHSRLKTKSGPEKYFCQASEIAKVTKPISKFERFSKCFDDLRAGNYTVPGMFRNISIWMFWKIRRKILGPYGRGAAGKTPELTLNLQTGERVVVQPLDQIKQTLDEKSQNRGLWFSPDMRLECGRQKIVQRRLEKIIVDGTGQMRHMKNTVYLEDSSCSCPHVAFGGCPRGEFVYWREIWLRRKESNKTSAGSEAKF